MMYTKNRNFKISSLILISILICLVLVSINTGHFNLTFMQIINTLLGYGTERENLILFEFRLPRILIAILSGIGLAVSGTILQAVYKNPLADPGVLGINAGASLAYVIYIAYFPIATITHTLFLPFVAFTGALLTSIIIYLIAYKKNSGVSPIRLILVAIAISGGISAFIILITIRFDPNNFNTITVWLSGSIWSANWNHVISLLPWIIVFVLLAIFKNHSLNILNLNDEISIGLGLNITKERIFLLIIAVALASASVALGGIFSFLGLIAPHLSRKIVGPKHQYLIITSSLTGAIILLASDTVARTLFMPSELPAGIIVSIIGAPYFLYLLVKH